mmetsp:Transcript_6769/g.28486  ORF Transcript_6769/g.28486 Transcript_6769/m.28486 type:complete len:567 (-) Transcript_6769:681-2381(-)
MAAVGPALEAVDREGQARTALGQVGRVDLREVAQADDLGARAGARDQRLHLLGRQVLGLVDDDELVQEGAPAHEVQALDLNLAAHEVVGGGAPPLAGRRVALGQYLEVVVEGAHPRAHLLFLGTGQEADVLADRHGHAGHDDLAVAAVVQHLGQAGGQRHQRLAGAGGAGERDEIALGVHQQVEREVLLAVAGGYAPDRVLLVAIVLQGLQHGGLAGDLGDLGVQRCRAGRFQIDQLIDQQRRDQRTADAVERGAALLPAFHGLAMALPEIGRQGLDAGVEQVGVFQRLVVAVVLRRQAQGAGLDAHVDVLGHQHDLAARVVRLQCLNDAEDLVVRLALRQALGQGRVDQLGLEEELALGLTVPGAGQRQALGHLLDAAALEAGGELVELAADLADVAGDLGHALLVPVQLLQRDHGQEDIVFLEAEQRHRIVHQHIRVEHEELGFTRRLAAAFGRSGLGGGLAGRLGRQAGLGGCRAGGRGGQAQHLGAGRGGRCGGQGRRHRRRNSAWFAGGQTGRVGVGIEAAGALCRRLGQWHVRRVDRKWTPRDPGSRKQKAAQDECGLAV